MEHPYENKLAFRAFLRRKLRKLSGEPRNYVREALGDEDICDVICYKAEKMAADNAGDPISFLEWLIAHWEEILAMIMTIIDLFNKE